LCHSGWVGLDQVEVSILLAGGCRPSFSRSRVGSVELLLYFEFKKFLDSKVLLIATCRSGLLQIEFGLQ